MCSRGNKKDIMNIYNNNEDTCGGKFSCQPRADGIDKGKP